MLQSGIAKPANESALTSSTDKDANGQPQVADDNQRKSADTPSRSTSLRALARYIGPFLWPEGATDLRVRVIIALGFLIIAKIVNIWVPFFLKDVVDALGVDDIATLPLFALLAYGGARLGAALFGQLRDAVFAKVGQRAGRRLALQVYRHLFSLSLRYHLQRRTGELSRAIERGVKALTFLLQMALFNVIPTILEFALVIIILLVRYPPSFALITFCTIVAYGIFTVIATEWRTKFRREMNARDNDFAGQAVDGLINYEMVKAFTNEEYEAAKLDRTMAAYEKAAINSQVSLALLNVGQAAIIAIGITVIMIVAAQEVVAGRLTVGDVVLVNAFILQLYQPLNLLGFVYREVKQSLTDLENLEALNALEPEITDAPHAKTLVLDGASVAFEQISFAYDARRPILDRVTLTIEPGQKLAVVGASGSGKSTLVKLLFRFYEPDQGAITIDGQNIADLTQKSLRAKIGVVPQDTVLFNDTIAANIGYGAPGASHEAVIEAAKIAQIHDFVADLPDGYDTVVGERGLKLSGGEKQRVAIARVALKNPPILVLDEATSALDSVTEQALQSALKQAAQGRTTLVIAHRLSTIIDAHTIIVLDKGHVVEHGNHRDLLAHDGHYARLWQQQQENSGS